MDNNKGSKDLSSATLKSLYYFLKAFDVGKKRLPNGTIEKAMKEFDCSARTVANVWRKGRMGNLSP
jgi:hypothetical protein